MHDPDELLDAAVRLFARDGTRGLTVAAVAREAKSPSGSVYHLYPGRPALLAAVWLRAVRRFQDAYTAAWGDIGTAAEAAASVHWVVDRCRADLGEALVLQAGPQAFAVDDWPPATAEEWARLSTERAVATGAIVRRVSRDCGLPRADVFFAMYDVPLAVLRRYLLAGEPPPASAADVAERLAGRLLAG
ncbi:hypothetical protein AXK60_23860 [Tsukamurella pseudospumae]|uniref:HTH tetR-type domain-containing protein n=2 Tax=Tsukamurella pseudospumae TaxID=239498 RepID=A0A138ANS9_9ACTN|nr:hypothetical protein AXK61_12400 [Tsukamurella pseudospumae]KXP12103.1 hypothetical protein AXK60_23860 [Tsukamurella pseudospumae]